jgi:hypothetical protein
MKKTFSIFAFYFILIFTQYSFSQWIQMSGGMGNSQITNAFSFKDNTIFAGTYGGLFISSNNGNSWTQSNISNNAVLSLAISGNNIYAGTNVSGVLISTNNGTTWSQTSLNNRFVFSLAASGNYVMAGVNDSGIYVSSNNGNSWLKTYSYISDIRSLAFNGNIIFAGIYGSGVIYSSNFGSDWIQTNLNNKPVFSLAFSGNYIFAAVFDIYNASERGVYRSINNGSSWYKTSISNISVGSLAVSGNNLFAGTESGVFLTTNNGENWLNKNQGFNIIPAVSVFLIANNYIFAGTNGKSVWRRSLSEILEAQNISLYLPLVFSLSENYPNPFNPVTRIDFDIPPHGGSSNGTGFVSLKVYDVLGREVQTLVNEIKTAGSYSVDFNGSDLTSGVYFYRLESEGFSDVKRMVLIK